MEWHNFKLYIKGETNSQEIQIIYIVERINDTYRKWEGVAICYLQ